jgi:hypothetical protein
MANLNSNQLSELQSVIDSNVNIWNRPIVNIRFNGARFVVLDHGDGRSTEYRWDGDSLRIQ